MSREQDSPVSFAITRELLENNRLGPLVRANNPGIRVLDEDELERSIAATLATLPARAAADDGIWVFGYGSLPWNPCIEIAERARVRVHGFHRDFCLEDTDGRGSADRPGLTLALAPGGSCSGIGLRIPASNLRHELRLLWRREMVTNVYCPRWVRMRGASGVVAGIAFVVNRAHPRYTGRLNDEAIAERIATGHGPLGPCREYLHRTLDQLEAEGLHDRHLHHVRTLVQHHENSGSE